MFDSEGYRYNVGMVITNPLGKVFLAKRIMQSGWQFPQGGILYGETPLQAMYRELSEETGLQAEDVKVLAESREWLRYRLPSKYQRRRADEGGHLCIGQRQKWFLLRLNSEQRLNLEMSRSPEFDDWRWVDYWYPAQVVIYFKREVYWSALREFAEVIQPQEAEPIHHSDS